MDAKHVDNLVKDWYTKELRNEWKRLQHDPYRQTEFIVTMRFLEEYLPKKGLILDAGGGPGRYTIELANRGYDVILLDITPKMLETARKKIKRAGVQRKVKQIVEGSIVDLSMFADGTFDAVLCLGGPLSHILDEKEREKAAKELVRVAKKGAPIFASVIGRIGLLKSILTDFPQEMRYAKVHWETGDYIPGVNGEGFTAAHWFLPEELEALFKRQGVQVILMAGLEGLSSHHRRAANKLSKDREKWNIWLEVLLATCTHPAVVGGSEHFLLVGRRDH
jgi:ubiquinone/menaquinone biosynthesis C-methylase UbiE